MFNFLKFNIFMEIKQLKNKLQTTSEESLVYDKTKKHYLKLKYQNENI